jgi:hypothetical protein
MIITYSEAPSFSPGWSVSIDTRRKVILLGLIDPSVAFSLSDHFASFDQAYASTDLQPDDEEVIARLFGNIHILVDPAEKWTLDGACHALSIFKGDRKIGLEWNSTVPPGCSGVEALVEKLTSLAESCKSKRDRPGGRPGYNP